MLISRFAQDLYTSLVGNTFTQNIMSSNPNITFDGRLSNDDPRVAAQAVSGVEDTLTSRSTIRYWPSRPLSS